MKIQTGYKLFEQNINTNKLYPLFINKKEPTPINTWVPAQIIEDHKGFAHRPGWHIGKYNPSAVWLMSANGQYKSQRGKNFKRVWCKVQYISERDYTNEVRDLPGKCFKDRLPVNGFYNFKESNNRNWIISDKIKITKILTEEERVEILKQNNYNEEEEFKPYKMALERRLKYVTN